MAKMISFFSEELLEEFACTPADVAIGAVVLSRILELRRFLERVSNTKQMAPTAAQKKDRNRLDTPKANPVALLKPNILPISMVPPSYVPMFPGLKLPRTFTTLVNASMTKALKRPIFTPISQRIKHTSDTAMHWAARFSEKLAQNAPGVL